MRASNLRRLAPGGVGKRCWKIRAQTCECSVQISRTKKRGRLRAADGCVHRDAHAHCGDDCRAAHQNGSAAPARKGNDLARKSVRARNQNVLPQKRKISDLDRRFGETSAWQYSFHAPGVQRPDEQSGWDVAADLCRPLGAADWQLEASADAAKSANRNPRHKWNRYASGKPAGGGDQHHEQSQRFWWNRGKRRARPWRTAGNYRSWANDRNGSIDGHGCKRKCPAAVGGAQRDYRRKHYRCGEQGAWAVGNLLRQGERLSPV